MAKKENIKNKLDMFQKETFQYERLEDVLGDRFGRYSKAIIQERAIPDVRDGLKPVQRRILYAMNHMKITSTSQYKKSARVCGEVMGKYHPHGDSSIYEAMVRMSQSWRMSVPLIDMQGNNGSIDGDGPAAMRYTESRLSKNADYLLEDIDKNTVPFIDNFDGEEKEPTVLPAKFPNLLVNGSVGISSGYATYIPTHNLAETIDATIYKIDHPNMTIDELLTIMPGPDFPTGGVVQGINGIKEAFLTGAGTVVVKSKISYEDFGDKQKRIVVTEIPFDTNKQKTVERIDQLRIDRKVDGIQEVRDESDRQGLRIAIDLKKGANETAILNYLLKNTDLQVNLKYNMVVIRNQRPERLGVLQILDAYIEHQKDVITNRTNYLLQKASDRLHIVEGLIKMVSILDEVIKTIRESKNKADSKDNLVKKFDFSERQAEAIVTMQLYRLSNTDVTALYEEKDSLNKNIIEYNSILNSDKKLLKVIKQELVDMKKNIVTPRRTEIQHEISDLTIDEQDLIQKEQNYFVATKDGYLKRVSIKNYNLSKLNTIKEKDSIVFEGEVSTTDVMLGFTNLGNFVYIPIFKVDECKMKDVGSYINNIATISPIEKLIRVFIISKFDDKTNLLLTTKNGLIKQTLLNDFVVSRYTKAVRAMKLQENDELISVDMTTNSLEIVCLTHECDALRFRASDVALYGTTAGGIKAIALKPSDYLVSAFYTNKNDDMLLLTKRGTLKRMPVNDLNLSKRARAGQPVIKKIKSNPHYLVDAKSMTPNQYKENVPVTIQYSDGVDTKNAFDIKYEKADAGVNILADGLGEPVSLRLQSPQTPDVVLSDDYLLEKDNNIDVFSFENMEEKPIKASRQRSIEDELDEILKNEAKESKNDVEFKKVSLFDDEDFK